MNELIERRIIIGLIFSKSFLAQVVPFLRLEYFRTKESKTLARIAVSVFKKYGKPPGEDIVSLVYDRNDSELLLAFVDGISEDEKEINVDVLVEETVEYFKKRSLEVLATNIEMSIAGGRVDLAEKELKEYKPVSKEVSLVIDPIDPDVVTSVFEYETEQLLRFPSHLGVLLNDLFVRDSFVAVMAPEKRGKTWFLVEVALRSWIQNLNVAFFEVGDMSKRQILRRFYSWMTKRPVGYGKEKHIKWPSLNCSLHVNGKCKLDIEKNGPVCLECLKFKRRGTKFRPLIQYGERVEKYATMEEIQIELSKYRKKLNKRKFKLSVHPNRSLTVSGLNDILKSWKDVDNFVPDVIVIDYADILLDEGSGEYRHRVNDTWASLRKLSQDWHCLVVTATQSDVKGHKADFLTQSNFSEDKRKLAHVTAMIGLNQKDEDKDRMIYKVNIIVAREKDYKVSELVAVGYSFDIGRPYLFSYFL